VKAPYSVRPTEITLLVQATILGFLIGELWYFGQAIGFAIIPHIQTPSRQGISLIVCALTAIIAIAYFYVRNGISEIPRLWRSRRIDLLALVALGNAISTIVGGAGTSKYKEYVGKVDVNQLILLCSIPVAIALLLVLKFALKEARSDNSTPFFINDQDIKAKDQDLLGLSENASRFAERVLNDGSADSLVFGIDSPWGIGKTSFLNFCCEYWKDDAKAKPIVHRFEPLRYTDNADLVVKFVDELINTIQKEAFVPSIGSQFSKYLRLIKGNSEFSFLGAQFELAPNSGTVDETLDTLKDQLSDLNRKIIIVVDDLDRLTWSEVKNILFAIKRSFMLPNVSYVLCYDTENLATLSNTYDDAEKVKEFLEKFVNVKIGLYLDSATLAELVTTNIVSAINNNLQLDAYMLDQIRKALSALEKIYLSDEFVNYQDLLGDIRKLKRLINTVILFEIQKTDFQNSDYNEKDLIHLLLVYINYPHIFRKIYNTETGGRSGFFSLILDNTSAAIPKYINSQNYIDYLASLKNKNQQFLLNKIFAKDTTFGNAPSASDSRNIDPAAKRIRACFNGPGYTSRNLERYLNLIVKLSKQRRLEGYRFYVNKKDDLLKGETLENILLDEDFNFSSGEFAHDQLWQIISNSAHEISPNIGSYLVSYILNHLPEYSFIEQEGIGAGTRISLIYTLLKILDRAAWRSNLTGRRNNSEKNIYEIAQWVFGENIHAEEGVLCTLAKAERKVLGLFDLLLFRLYCSADRGSAGSDNILFNLQRAILLHSDPSAQASGVTTEIAREGMREISQETFRIFFRQYIKPKINIFDAVDELSLADFLGESTKFVRSQIKLGKIKQEQIDELIEREKTHLIVFTIYQLGNSLISSGVGCGLYDENGKFDGHGIATRINDYLFDVCFNPAISSTNYERFLDYLLMNFSHTFDGGGGFHHVPSLDEFTKVIHRERLQAYWLQHRAEILKLDFAAKDKRVVTANYVATYEMRLTDVFRVLDELIESTETASQ
jgi:hypothetical protein